MDAQETAAQLRRPSGETGIALRLTRRQKHQDWAVIKTGTLAPREYVKLLFEKRT